MTNGLRTITCRRIPALPVIDATHDHSHPAADGTMPCTGRLTARIGEDAR